MDSSDWSRSAPISGNGSGSLGDEASSPHKPEGKKRRRTEVERLETPMIKDWKALVGKKRRRISRAPSSEGAHSEEEVLVSTSSLRLDADGALSDQALSLSKQLQSALPHDGEDGDDSLSRKVATEAILFEEQVRDECGNEEFCLVFVGMNGSGKSTSINMIVQLTELRESAYGINGVWNAGTPDATDEGLKKWLCNNLEAVQDLLKLPARARPGWDAQGGGTAAERMARYRAHLMLCIKFEPREKVDADGHYIDAQERGEEVENMEMLKHAWKEQPEAMQGFLLTGATGECQDTTTKMETRLKRGLTYHVRVLYKSENAICEELAGFDWAQLEDLNEASEEDKLNASFKRELLIFVYGLSPDISASDLQTHIPASAADVRRMICPSVSAKLRQGVEIFSGRGRKKLEDRLWVRTELRRLTTDLQVACIADDVTVYVPAEVLDKLTIVDTPGAGVTNPVERAALYRALSIADGWAAVQGKHFGAEKGLVEELEQSGVLQKLLQQPAVFPLFVLNAMQENCNQFRKLQTFLKSELLQMAKKQAEIRCLNSQHLRKALQGVASTLGVRPPDGKSEQELVDTAMRTVEANMFASRPMLWTSLQLSGPELCDDPKWDNAKVAEANEALGEFGRFLAKLQGFSSQRKDAIVLDKVAFFLEALDLLVRPSGRQVSAEAVLSPEMVTAARREAAWRSTPDRRPDKETMLEAFDKVYIKVKDKETYDFVHEQLAAAMSKMEQSVDIPTIVNELESKLNKNASSWRSLLNAFDTRLAGTYKKVQIFQIFFRQLQLPSTHDLEAAIQAQIQRQFIVLLRVFMRTKVLEVLRGAEGTHTRSVREAAPSERLVGLIKEAVDGCIPLEYEQRSNMLEEALGVLHSPLGKGKVMDSDRVSEACRDSLRKHLLEVVKPHKLGKGDRRKREGKDVLEQCIQAVKDNASKVLKGVRETLTRDVEEAIMDALGELNYRFVEPRKGRGLPTLFKLYKMCFKQVLELSGNKAEQPAPESEDAESSDLRAKALVDEVRSKLLVLDSCHGENQQGRRLLDGIATRQLLSFLEGRCEFPQGTNMARQRLGRGRKVLPQNKSLEVLQQMKSGDRAQIGNEATCSQRLEQLLRKDKVELGRAAADNNCLFHALLQALLNDRNAFQEGHQQLREGLVTLALQQHQTPALAAMFQQQHASGLSVHEWASEMRQVGVWGDEHCLEAFACHYQVRVLLYTPYAPDAPIKFPLFRALRSECDDVVRIAHVPLVDGEDRPNHFVPVWPKRISFSPAPPMVREVHQSEEEREAAREAYAPVKQAEQEQRKRNHAKKAKAEQHERNTARRLLEDPPLPPGWSKQWSNKLNKPYWSHEPSKKSQWEPPDDDGDRR